MRHSLPHTLRWLLNGLRKVAAGLRPFNEAVWPGVRNDLFVAHESIYGFAARYASGKDVLDAGCGTGYGSAILKRSARSVAGVDLDRRNIAYARRRYAAEGLTFAVANLETLEYAEPCFDLIVASNSLEHLEDPARFVRAARAALRPGGVLLVAVPPIYGAGDAEVHSHIHYHRANLTVAQWRELLVREGFATSAVLHLLADADKRPDFTANDASVLQPSDFAFEVVRDDEMLTRPSITAIFVARFDALAPLRGATERRHGRCTPD